MKIIIIISMLFIGNVHATGLSYRGYTVAGELANDYILTSTECGKNNDPLYQCSGVLLHGVTESGAEHIWEPTDEEINMGGMSFAFLRMDANFKALAHDGKKGFITYPTLLAPVRQEVLTPLCGFPVGADTQERTNNGCGASPAYPDDSVACQDMNITTSSQWYTHYNSVADADKQAHECGFTLSTANDFVQMLGSINLVADDVFNAADEMMFPIWSTTVAPADLPLQALFYTDKSELSSIQADQQDYYNATRAFIPVIYIDLPVTTTSLAAFIYNESDQVVNDVAAVLTAQYNDTRRFCNTSDRPVYLCSGIVLRATDPSKEKPWEPDSKNLTSGGTSFSYLRADTKFNRFAYSRDNGYIFYPADDRLSGNAIIDVLCAFPIDAATDNRVDAGCGKHSGTTIDSEECQYQNIYTSDEWLEHYISGGRSHNNQCGFIVSKDSSLNRGYDVADAFYQYIIGISDILPESFNTPNELRLQTWSTVPANQLPIQAFFYVNSGLAHAQANQNTYYSDNNIVIPIVKITLPVDQNHDAEFTYSAADQVVTSH